MLRKTTLHSPATGSRVQANIERFSRLQPALNRIWEVIRFQGTISDPPASTSPFVPSSPVVPRQRITPCAFSASSEFCVYRGVRPELEHRLEPGSVRFILLFLSSPLRFSFPPLICLVETLPMEAQDPICASGPGRNHIRLPNANSQNATISTLNRMQRQAVHSGYRSAATPSTSKTRISTMNGSLNGKTRRGLPSSSRSIRGRDPRL